MGYRQNGCLEANSGHAGCANPAGILNGVLGRNSRVIKRSALGPRMAKAKKESGDEDDDEEDDEENDDEEEPKLKPPPSRPAADPWTTGNDRQIITGIEHPEVTNLCYVNAALQALAATSYPEWVKTATLADYTSDPSKGDLVNLVDGIFDQLNRFTTKKYMTRATVKTPTADELCVPDLGQEQHCSVELIVRVNDLIRQNTNIPDYKNLFEVESLARRNCLDCGNVWTQVEQFPSLQLNKPLKKAGTVTASLEWCRRIEHWRTGGCKRCRALAIRKILRRALKNSKRDGTSAANKKTIRDRIRFLEQSLQNHTINTLTEAEEKNLGLARRASYPRRPQKAAGMTAKDYKILQDAYQDELKRRTINYDSDWAQTHEITNLPDILIMEFANVPSYSAQGRPIKLKTRVTFDPSIDLTDYVAGPNRNVDTGSFNLPIRITLDDANPKVPMFELRSILVHQGVDFRAGHWYCYRREWKDPTNPLSEQWWYCDEASTLRVSKQDIFKATREDPRATRPGQIYALIYEKVPEGGAVPDGTGDETRTTLWRQA
ncbi:hypothetical protein TWF718_011255 [Orbilia javanica]|uniref:USP domain-containing protein n=1 Tax=Orbilia javanica TaxID=47235 RepID=A0AAN8ML50_9PEZI